MIVKLKEEVIDLNKTPAEMIDDNTVGVGGVTVPWSEFYEKCDKIGVGASVDFRGQSRKVICVKRAS